MTTHETVKLTNCGLFGEKWNKAAEDYVLEGMRAGKKVKGEFLWKNWNTTFTIQEGFTLLNLIEVLSGFNAEELHVLSMLSNANLASHLIDFAKNPDPVPDDDDGCPLNAIEVYKSMELSNYDSCGDEFTMNQYSCAHGLGAVWEDAIKSAGKSKKKLKEAQACNTYAIEFTPWQKMLNLPIVLKKHVIYGETHWKKVKPHKMEFDVVGSKKKFSLGTTDRDMDFKSHKYNRKILASFTMGEFFTGLFNELCFFSSPESRQGKEDEIKDRMKIVEKDLKKKKK